MADHNGIPAGSPRLRLSAVKLPDARFERGGPQSAVIEPTFAFQHAPDVTIITIFAEIGGPAGVTPDRIEAELHAASDRPVLVKLNSPGGDFFDGLTIFNQLVQHRAEVTVQVLGVAASAASIIAMAADRIEIASEAKVMIHRAWTLAFGNEEDMAKASAILKQIDGSMSRLYATRANRSTAEMAALMKAETWLTGIDAVRAGLADAVLEGDALPAPKMRKASARTRTDMERGLRSLGLSRSAAARVAHENWPHVGATTGLAGASELVAMINAARRELRNGDNR